MHHPLRNAALATLIATVLITLIPDDTTRHVLMGMLILGCTVKLCKTYAKKPRLCKQARREMMAYHIDRGLELANDDAERQILIAWVNAKLED